MTGTKYLLTCLPGWHQSVWKYSAERYFSSVMWSRSSCHIYRCGTPPSGTGCTELDTGLGCIQITFLHWTFRHFSVQIYGKTSKQMQKQDRYLRACQSLLLFYFSGQTSDSWYQRQLQHNLSFRDINILWIHYTPYCEKPCLCSNKSAYWRACCFYMCTH